MALSGLLRGARRHVSTGVLASRGARGGASALLTDLGQQQQHQLRMASSHSENTNTFLKEVSARCKGAVMQQRPLPRWAIVLMWHSRHPAQGYSWKLRCSGPAMPLGPDWADRAAY